MAQAGGFVTLGDLLEEKAETEQDEPILERVKILAQEHLPDGWTQWQVANISKEEIFGQKPESSILNKLVFALPTVGLAQAFNPDADHLSEKGYKEMRCKLLDWAFARGLILGPPAVANRIRGSAARTELFKQSVEVLQPLLHTRAEADRILSGHLSESVATRRRRRSSSVSSRGYKRKKLSHSPSRYEMLEKKMDNMFAILMNKMDACQQSQLRGESRNHYAGEDSDSEGSMNYTSWKTPRCPSAEVLSEDEGTLPSVNSHTSGASWIAPQLDDNAELSFEKNNQELEFLPQVKEAEPLVPEPSPQIKAEGIQCQKLGTDGWNRIRYKEVEKSLHAAPVFSALKVNTELGGQSNLISPAFARQEGMLGTITHGLLLQRKALAEELKRVARNCPAAAEEVRKILAENTAFKTVSDNLLHYVCAHRAETIEIRRKSFKTKNEVLSVALQKIPPSESFLFDEKSLASFIKDNGGVAQIFPSKFGRYPEKREGEINLFRKPAAPTRASNSKSSTWRTRPSGANQSATQAAARRPLQNNAPAKRQSGSNKLARRLDKRQQKYRRF